MPAGLPGCKTQRVNAGTPRSTGAGSGPRGDLDWPDLTSLTLARSCVVWFDAYPSQQCAVVSCGSLLCSRGCGTLVSEALVQSHHRVHQVGA